MVMESMKFLQKKHEKGDDDISILRHPYRSFAPNAQ